jgi:Ca2+-binding RTX toxin-like protein
MSFHFLKGTTSDAYADIGPGKIIVDRGAVVHTNIAATDALALSSGPWTLLIDGAVGAGDGDAIDLGGLGAFVSNITLGKHAVLTAPNNFGIGINASHATNITNAGLVTGVLAGIAETGDGNFRIENQKSGGIGGFIGIDIESLGTHAIVNAGDVSGTSAAIRTWSGIEHLKNSGTLGGDVELGEGNDTFTNFIRVGNVVKHGLVTGTIFLGGGDDVFNGGKHFEIVTDEDGKDIVKLGGGNDGWNAQLSAADGADVVDGGRGIDTYDASGLGAQGIVINLDTRAHTGIGPQTASYGNAATVETVRNFENAYGSDAGDTLVGSKGANILSSNAGDDVLCGLGGRDQFYGGTGEDSFVFLSLKDSGPTKASRDTIHDFELGADHIQLANLNEKLGDIITGFLGVDVAFTGHKGDLRAITSGDNTIVQLDVNGDRHADFSIQLDGHIALTANDFSL